MQAQDKPSNGSTGAQGAGAPPSTRPSSSRPPSGRPSSSRPPSGRPSSSRPPPSRPPPAHQKPGPTGAAAVVPELLAGGISGALLITHGLAFAALIFAGDLRAHLPAGVGALLLSSAILAAAVALGSSFKPVIASPQDTTAVLLALIAGTIAHEAATPEDILPTLVAVFAVSAAATGVLFSVLGALRLGKIVRFIPYPVVGGFLAGTGWLLVRGSLAVLTGAPVRLDTASALFAGGALIRWVPGVAYGLIAALAVRRFRAPWVLPALLALGPVLFYAALGASGHSVEDASNGGLLLGPFAPGDLFPAVKLADLGHVRWGLLRDSAGLIVALLLLAAISVLLKATALEQASEQEIDLDRELRAAGVANLLAGALGAPLGYLSIGESILNHKLGARTRAPGLLAALICVLALAFGEPVLAYFPRALLGGLLFSLGVSVLIDATYAAWFRLPRGEYALVILILLTVVTVGFLEGMGLGIVISSVLFALNYARINVVKHVISGALLRSKASRPATSDALLQQLGRQIHVFKLQGYLFFGTAYNLLSRVQERMNGEGAAAARYIVLDFRHVDGIDSSAVLSFAKMRKLAEAHGVTLGFTDLPKGVRKQLERGGCVDAKPPGSAPNDPGKAAVVVFLDLDHGLEWCEDQLLSANADSRPSSDAMERELADMSKHQELVGELSRYLERVEAAAGFEVFKQGDVSKDLYLIESGEVAAWLLVEGGREKRLRTMGAGSVVGEAGLYLGAPRSASVRATRSSVLYRLTTSSLERMTREAPKLAATFHHFVAQLLAERVVNTTTEAQMVFY